MAIVLLREERVHVQLGLAGAVCRGGLHEAGGDNAEHEVDQDHERAEHVNATSHAHQSRHDRVVNLDTREDEEKHADEVDPVGKAEDERMRLRIVYEMCHDYRPPQGLVCILNSRPVLGSTM